MTFSPTGYWANFTYVSKPLDGGTQYRGYDPRPILRWTEDGDPVVADEAGKLLTVKQYLAAETPASDDTDVWSGHYSVDVRPQFNPEEAA